MRLSEIDGKEIIDLSDGEILGIVGDSDLAFDENTGSIEAIILPEKGKMLGNLFKDRREITIPWAAVKKIGPQIIIVELSERRFNYPWTRR
jgi:YlmC/YmxH family sporulation protein